MKRASLFDHSTQVSTQVQLASTCNYLPFHLARALNKGLVGKGKSSSCKQWTILWTRLITMKRGGGCGWFCFHSSTEKTFFFESFSVFLFKQDLVDQGKALKLTLQLITTYDPGNDCRKVHSLLITP